MKYTPEMITELAKKWYNDKTKRNADAVIQSMDILCKWWVERRRTMTKHTSIQYDDMLQEARIGVWMALRKYDGERGFTTYASFWINQRIIRLMDAELHMVKFPRNDHERKICFRYSKLMRKIEHYHPRANLRERHEIMAEMLSVPVEYIEAHGQKMMGVNSLDYSFTASKNEANFRGKLFSDDACKLNTIHDDPDPEQTNISEIDRQSALSTVRRIARGFDDRKKDVVNQLLIGDGSVRQVDLAEKYDVTRQRIEQIVSSTREEVIFWARREMGLR